jgi:hypothetical protein
MSKTQLSSSEIQDLINRYHSELKKLEFQVDEVITTIAQLERLLENVNGREKSAIAKVKIKKSKSLTTAPSSSSALVKKGKRGRPKKIKVKEKDSPQKAIKKVKKSGYKLSIWDQYVIDSLKQAGNVRITQEIIDFVKNKASLDKLKTTDEEIKNKVTRSLQKLANRRNDITKVPYKGKGFAYAIPAWFNSKGKLDNKYKK